MAPHSKQSLSLRFLKPAGGLKGGNHMFGGYMNRLLRVDLTCGKFREEKREEAVLKKFLGGSSLAAKILVEQTQENTGPLLPENKLIFMTGRPTTDTAVPTSSRHKDTVLDDRVPV